MYSINKTHKPRKPALGSTRLLDQLRERLRYMHYSLRTEQNYVCWSRWFIRWHGLKHLKDMGGKEVEAFLSMLANECKVAPSTHRQALSALLYLYKKCWISSYPGCRKSAGLHLPSESPSF
jgi:hypothetical protein